MPDDGKTIFIFIAIVLVVVGIGYTYTKNPDFFKNLMSSSVPFFYDPYLMEYDFNIPSPSLVEPHTNSYCSSIINREYGCNDNIWEINGKTVCYTCNVYSKDGYLYIDSNGADCNAKYLINLKNKDIKLSFVQSSSCGCGKCTASATTTLFLNDILLDSASNKWSQGGEIPYTYELIKDVTDKNKFTVKKNGEAVNEVTVQGDEAFLSFSFSGGTSCGCAFSPKGGILKLSSIKSQPYFSCLTDNNEVWVSDSFGEGSVFDIHSLTYEPTKFCPQDYPAVVRDFRERGTKADYKGTITERLTRGEKFTVPTFQSYEIRYATTYKEGMGTRCDINEVYDTKLKKCIGKIFEQDYIIKDCHSEGCPDNSYICRDNGVCDKYTNTIVEKRCLELGCPTSYDCLPEGYCVKTLIQQVKPTCADITCDVNYQEYCEMRGDFPVCVRPYKIIEIRRDREIITIGKNQKSFTNMIVIGDKRIISSIPTFTCDPKGENWNFPQPDKNCWQTEISYQENVYPYKNLNTHTMKDGDEVSLNDYINLKLYISGHYDKDKNIVDNYENGFILTLKNFDFLTTEPIKGDKLDYYMIKDSSRQMCFKLTNELGINFNSEQSGYSLKKTTDLVTMQSTSIESKPITTGTTQFCIPIDSTRYGEIFYQINPYFKIGDEMFFDNEQVVYNYKIVDTIPVNETIVYHTVTTGQEINQTTTTVIKEPFSFTDVPIYVWVGLLLFIGLIIYLSIKK